jgi:hypothetical protein
MTGGAECIGEKETIEQAAKKLAEIDSEQVGELIEAISAAS